MTEPTVLMLDEPTAGVSPIVMDELFDRIIDVAKTGIAILMVEQNARQALEIADRGYVLVQGKNAYTDTGANLLADKECAKHFWGAKSWIYFSPSSCCSKDIVIPGLVFGSQLALGALGITLIYSILRFATFAHSESMAFSGALMVLCLQVTGWLGLGSLAGLALGLPFVLVGTVGCCWPLIIWCFGFISRHALRR